MVHSYNGNNSILLHQRIEVWHAYRDHLFRRLAIVDRAVVPVVRAVDSPQSCFRYGASCEERRRCDNRCTDEMLDFHDCSPSISCGLRLLRPDLSDFGFVARYRS